MCYKYISLDSSFIDIMGEVAENRVITNNLSREVVDIVFQVHNTLGPGLLESIYEEVLCYELQNRDLQFTRQQAIPDVYKDKKLDLGFRADIIVENKIIIEIKSIESIAPVHHKQILSYLKLSNVKLGLLVNFNVSLIKDGIHRIVNNF